MNVQFLVTPEQCALAAAKLRARKAVALDRLEVIEREHQQRMVDYIQGRITDSELDDIQAEKARLQILKEEDHSWLHQKLTDRKEQLRLAEIRRANMLASYQSRCEFAERFNAVLEGTDSCDAQQMNWFKEHCPGGMDTAAFWRFSTMMWEFDCLPKAKRVPYGQHCRCDEYVPEPLEH